MGLLDKIKSAFETDEQQPDRKIVIEPDEAPEMVKNAYSGQIETAKKHEKGLIDETDELLNQLESNLEEVEEYEDVEGIKAAEDIAQSFYNSRKIMIENFNPKNTTESYEEALEEFLSEFNNVDRKEKALMERMKSDVVGIAENVQELGDKLEEIQKFNEKGKKMLHDIDDLEDKAEQYNETVNLIGEKENSIQEQETKIDKLEENLESKKEEIEELKESDKWAKKQEKDEELDSINEELNIKQNRLSRSASNLDRGLKKLIYQVENQEMDFSGDLKNLKKLKEENFEDLEPVKDDLVEARKKIQEEELLSGRQLEEFEEEVEDQPEFTSVKEEISELESEKKELKKELKESEANRKKKKIENKINELENKIENSRKEQEKIENELEELETEKETIKSDLKKSSEDLMNEPVKFKTSEEPQQ